MILYHVSLTANHESILKSGVDPLFSQGALNQSWFVDSSRLLWSIAHVSARHNTPVSQLEIWSRDSSRFPKLYKSRYAGIFRTPCRIVVEKYTSATEYVEVPK